MRHAHYLPIGADVTHVMDAGFRGRASDVGPDRQGPEPLV